MNINVIEYLEESVEKYPDKIIFADENNSITYKDFLIKAKIVATNLLKEKYVVNSPIFVLIDRSINSLIAFFGVIYSGNFYVPCDINLPQNRLDSMYELLKPRCIIELDDGLGCKYFNNDNILNISKLCLGEVDEGVLDLVRKRSIDTDAIYSMFTSGSTGIPKNIVISHRSVVDLVEQFESVFDLDDTCILGNQAPFDFDVSIKDIFLTIKLGATMNIIDKKMFSFPTMLIEYLNDRKVNTIIWSTSAMKIVSLLGTFKVKKPLYLKNIMFSGEVMSIKILNDWMNSVDARYVNLYGPTEITCNCTYYIVNRKFNDTELLPIGNAFRNSQVYIFDNGNVITDVGVKGEICVRGTCLALGYYGDFEKTNEVFVQNPLNNCYPEKIYRTGDIGMYNELGEIVFLGRIDSQIKYMGHRIELTEIESVINSIEYIDFGCCIYDENREKICMFYQAKENHDKDVVTDLKKLLPKYMVPSVVYYFEKLPENKNGKIDRVFLKHKYIEGCEC